jgi:hypothetical protein
MFKKVAVATGMALAACMAIPKASAQPDKAQYELEARCGRDASAFFRQLDPSATSFTNHYNPDLNRCFALVHRTFRKPSGALAEVNWELWDVNENRQLDILIVQLTDTDREALSRPRPVDAPEPRKASCVLGNFPSCPYAQRFADKMLRYMQRTSAE